MNYLSSSNYFHIKNPFSILFIQFKRVLDWASIIRKVRGLGARIPRHSVQYPQDGGLIQRNPRGSYAKLPRRRGVSSASGRPIGNLGSRLDQHTCEPVCDQEHRIPIQRPILTHASVPTDPLDQHPTVPIKCLKRYTTI